MILRMCVIPKYHLWLVSKYAGHDTKVEQVLFHELYPAPTTIFDNREEMRIWKQSKTEGRSILQNSDSKRFVFCNECICCTVDDFLAWMWYCEWSSRFKSAFITKLQTGYDTWFLFEQHVSTKDVIRHRRVAFCVVTTSKVILGHRKHKHLINLICSNTAQNKEFFDL